MRTHRAQHLYHHPSARSGRSREGTTLIECLIYIAVVTMLLGMGISLLSKMIGFHRDLERNAADIARCLNAGERWRADLRRATGPVRTFRDGRNDMMEIPTGEEHVLYRYDQYHLWRHTTDTSVPILALKELTRCEFIQEARSHTKTWRWEVELRTLKRVVNVQPRFTFLAVSQSGPPTQGNPE